MLQRPRTLKGSRNRVSYEVHDPAAVITLKSPQTRDALRMPMVDAIMPALRHAEERHARFLVLTGELVACTPTSSHYR
jgi:enoyl-CoA hydratase/carnithine racemase